ncbi:hypothetical protein [Arthrobacter sp. Soil736]|uniref:hypothetical protein n=1 Tax=Arthrobacter sp. Soil736 TaxID=1736395 RepID=UPI0012FBD919|nr:hypothetical protein [Arthrobacter sp. Soil736]
MAKYVVGEFSFAKKGEAEQLLRSVLEELEVGAMVTDPLPSHPQNRDWEEPWPDGKDYLL